MWLIIASDATIIQKQCLKFGEWKDQTISSEWQSQCKKEGPVILNDTQMRQQTTETREDYLKKLA